MNPSKLPVSDDLSSTGYALTENVGPANDEAEINFSGVTFGQTTFSSGIMLVSTSLSEDLTAWTTTETLVKRTAAARLSRIMNNTWLPVLKTALAANSSATVSAAGSNIAEQDIPTLVSAVGAAYRLNATFVMSPATQKSISLLLDGNGRPVYRHVLEANPTLLGYPVHIVNGAATKDILFGDFSYAIAKSVPMELRTLRERFILDGYIGLILQQRADFKWTVASTSDSPVKTLSFS
jgi:HK97 family phage major capsid protein